MWDENKVTSGLLITALLILIYTLYLVNALPDKVEEVVKEPEQEIYVMDLPNFPEYEEYETDDIIRAIAFLETQNGKTGVGHTKNNLTGIFLNGSYATFETKEESFAYSAILWENRYSEMDIEDALARWKTGDPKNRDAETIKYIKDFYKVI